MRRSSGHHIDLFGGRVIFQLGGCQIGLYLVASLYYDLVIAT